MFINIFYSLVMQLFAFVHPLYISVVDVLHNQNTSSIEVTVKIYTDDFEAALKKNYNKPFDLINPTDKNEANKYVTDYIKNHVKIQVNGSGKELQYVGYEKNDASIWAYFEIPNITTAKSVKMSTNLLFDYTNKQNNIIHVTLQNERKSKRLSYPETDAEFSW